MSRELTWQIIRKNSAFIRKQTGIKKLFSTEKFNLKGVNSPRYNGLINSNAVDIQPSADKKTLIVSTKNSRESFVLLISSRISRFYRFEYLCCSWRNSPVC